MCECVEKMDKMLKEQGTNTAIALAFTGDGGSRVQIVTMKLDNKVRKSASLLLASYCPFCGKEWEG